jgi:DNA-binding NarL/FixJ family response regulator
MPSTAVRNILIIDDDPDDYAIFKEALHELGEEIAVSYIGSSREAVADKACPVPDLLFLDINMPDRNGFEWLKYIREQGYRFPVIMYSTASHPDYVQRAYREGAHIYFPKPDSFHTLQHSLRQLLSFDWRDPEKVRERFIRDGNYTVFHLPDASV